MVEYDRWWVAARVTKVHDDGTYDMVYDGKAQQQLPHAQVPGGGSAYEGKKQHYSFEDYMEHAKVYGMHLGVLKAREVVLDPPPREVVLDLEREAPEWS